jgi:hypothetical protein
VTKMLPVLVAAGTALITTAMVQAVYGLFWLGQYLFGSTVPSYDWRGAFTISGVATTVVLLASLVALRLMASRQPDDGFAGSDLSVSAEVAPAAIRIAGTPE